MSAVFLFGAGASFGSGPCHPHAPPLGAKLFTELRAAGGIAATIDDDLANAFDDFEVGMDRFWAERNSETTELLRDMARFFAPFTPLPGNAYLKLFKILGGTREKAVMVTTNYDLLIERAAAISGCFTSYTGFPVGERNVPVLKIHGSCNFLPDIPPMMFSNIEFDLSNSPNVSVLESRIKIATSTAEILQFCNTENSIGPALAMYSPSKHVLYCRDVLEMQQKAWLGALSDASRIYVVGLRVHTIDKHIWGPLANSKAPIHYVGREPKDFTDWANDNNRQEAYVLANSFQEALPGIAEHYDYRDLI